MNLGQSTAKEMDIVLLIGDVYTVARLKKSAKTKMLGNGLLQIRDNGRPRRARADGKAPTKPVVQCPPIPELGDDGVMERVTKWCEASRLLRMNRLNNGAGYLRGRAEYGSYGIPGGADLLGWVIGCGKHIEIECKAGEGGHLRVSQQERMLECWKDGGIYLVVHGVPELEYFIDTFTKNMLTFEIARGTIEFTV